MRLSIVLCTAMVMTIGQVAQSQQAPTKSSVWSPDNGDGSYTNPIIYADYSDPDAIRVGDDYYMTSSSFSHFPGLPILHSRDLVNWRIIGHAAQRYPSDEFTEPQHGTAIWAPSIRYHNGEFYIYFGDPDRGVFMTKTKNPAGPWEPLRLIRKVTGWIDTCPFWDEDGNAYLVHAWANSRAGIKSILAVNRMNKDGTEVLDDGVVVFVGHFNHPTIEGPKFHKRNGYYYIFAPAGGVKPGWQTVLRSKNIYGPYEDKKVLEQGSTNINGPHQGAWIDTKTGEDWFIHFQDRYAYGRILHLQPMRWENDWPVMGIDYDKNGIGEPVMTHKKPNVGATYAIETPQTSDEFDSASLGLQWQWEANFKSSWFSLDARTGWLRFYPQPLSPRNKNLWSVPNLMLQKMPAAAFTATARIEFAPVSAGEKFGLVVFGLDYSYIGIGKSEKGFAISHVVCLKADNGTVEETIALADVSAPDIYLRVEVRPDKAEDIIPKVLCSFSYSTDGVSYNSFGTTFTAREGRWVGAKVGVFSLSPVGSKQSGHADLDWFKIEPFEN